MFQQYRTAPHSPPHAHPRPAVQGYVTAGAPQYFASPASSFSSVTYSPTFHGHHSPPHNPSYGTIVPGVPFQSTATIATAGSHITTSPIPSPVPMMGSMYNSPPTPAPVSWANCTSLTRGVLGSSGNSPSSGNGPKESQPPATAPAPSSPTNAGEELPADAMLSFYHKKEDAGKSPVTPSKVGLDDFVLLCKVGEGIAGKVWKVKRKADSKFYAMKVMHKAAMAKPDVLEMLKAERSVMAVLSHPFIVSLKWAFQTKERAYLVMDWLGGGELGKHLEQQPGRRFPEERVKFYAAQLVSSFEYLHSKNIIYRDLKLDNVLLDDEGNACLVDFGLWERPYLPGQSFFGAPNSYLTPEMLKGDAYGCENDWWQLGVLLYEMITGGLPWPCYNWPQLHREIMSPVPVNPPLNMMSAEAADLLKRMLWKDKRARLMNAKDIKAHPWFRSIDFQKLLDRKLTPPFVPVKKCESVYFRKEDRQNLSFCQAPAQSFVLRGFTFVAPSVLAQPIPSMVPGKAPKMNIMGIPSIDSDDDSPKGSPKGSPRIKPLK